MKICLVFNFAPHYRKNIFELIDKSIDCDFIFGDKCLDVRKMDYNCLTHSVYEVNNCKFGPFIWRKGLIKYFFRYDRFISIGEPLNITVWLLLLYSFFFKKKVFLWSHGWYGREGFVKKIIKRCFFGLSDGVFLYGNYARELMIKNGFKSSKLHVVYNSLDYDKQLELRKKISQNDIYIKHFGNTNVNIIFVGRLTKVKKLDMLLYFLKYYSERGKCANVTFIGDGEYMTELVDLVSSLKLNENVWFYGASYNEEELANLIYNADLCVSPGNVGLTAIHSLSFGCPVITHDNFQNQMPEFESVIKGETGDFYKYGSQISLNEVIENWLNNYPSNKRELIRQTAYKTIDTYWNPYYQIEVIKDVVINS